MQYKTMTFVLLVTLGALFPLGGQEVESVWERIYRNSTNDEQRYAIMLNIIELKSRGFGPLLQESLEDLITRRIEAGTPSEVRVKITLAKLIIQVLGDTKTLEAAPTIYKVFEEANDPFLKGEAALNLGKMRAVEYAPALARLLTILNFMPDTTSARKNEILAYALVQSLEIMKNPLGYEPIFFASLGWYSNRSQVRDLAQRALSQMVDDPSESLLAILKTNLELNTMNQVLDAGENSKASQVNKALIARSTLQKALDSKAQNKAQKQSLSAIKTKAIRMLIVNQDQSAESAELLKKNFLDVYGEIGDEGELLNSVTALGANATNGAISFLSEKLMDFNAREKNRLNNARDAKIIREIIAAMARAKNPLARPALMEMQFSGYSNETVRQAKTALESLQG